MPILHKLKYIRDNKAFKNHGNEVLLKAKEALDEINVDFWLDFGTLLGAFRDGKLIGHDTDIDIAVMLEDYSPDIEKTLVAHGFKYERKISVDEGNYALEQCFSYRNVKLDIFYYSKAGNQCFCHLFPQDENKIFLVREIYTTYTGFKKMSFLGEEFLVPSDIELRLIETYGNDYKIPILNWYTPDDALNSKIIDKNCKEIKYI